MGKFEVSDLWVNINENIIKNGIDLKVFRGPGNELNSRLATWDSYDLKSYRYYKNILFNTVISMPPEFFELYKKINDTNIGNPVTVTVKDLRVNMEYLFSIMEIMFLKEIIEKSRSIVEIGGGYGRLCHSIVQIFPLIEEYIMVDLPEMLPIAKRYLAATLNKSDFNKITFIEADMISEISHADLFINIDSFTEMTATTIDHYNEIINNKGQYFFCKNTVGKYNPKDIGLKVYNQTDIDNASKVGRCLDKVDIFNDKELDLSREKYLINYLPSSEWILLKDEVAYPYTYYHSALFGKRHNFEEKK